jgi:1-acyl-sn-glycerol-3-phosphate acyltransferase
VLLNFLDRGWRLAGTGLAFALIFGGGAIGAITILPLIAALRLTGRGGSREAQHAIHWYFRFYIWLLQCLGVIAVEVQGQEKLAQLQGRLVVANHPTLLDVVLLMALMPRAQCIVKHELWNSRYLGGVVRVAGYIPNNLEPEALLQACRNSIDLGDNLIIFPEGTRTRPGERPHFQRGFANIALLTAAPIQLVTITCTPLTLTKGEPWWRIPPRRPHFLVQVGDNLDTEGLLQHQGRSLAARALVRHLETYYGERLATG